MKNPLIVALDTTELRNARKLVRELKEYAGIFKVGCELFTSFGFDIVHMIQDEGGAVFLDLKYHDIPQVVAVAAQTATREGVKMLTLHSLGGRKMLEKTQEEVSALAENSRLSPPLLLGVTILTSLGNEDLPELGITHSLNTQIVNLARICQQSNLQGVVCSPKEISLVREEVGDSFIIVTPGIRMHQIPGDDQKRVATPQEAIKKGADYIVVGRPITQSKNPAKEAEQILEKISQI